GAPPAGGSQSPARRKWWAGWAAAGTALATARTTTSAKRVMGEEVYVDLATPTPSGQARARDDPPGTSRAHAGRWTARSGSPPGRGRGPPFGEARATGAAVRRQRSC